MYDLIIVGGGPGGLTAGIYAQRSHLKTVLLEKMGIGGQICMSDVIENYPGFKSIAGLELMKHFEAQAKDLGLEIKFAEVTAVRDLGEYKEVETSEGPMRARAVIVSTGARPRRLGVPGEADFIGRGVSFCATCDGFFFKEREVAVVGGGDAALKEGLFLSKIVKKVHIIHRRDKFRAEKITQDKALREPNFVAHLNKVVTAVRGDFMGVHEVGLKDTVTGEESELAVDGVFIFVGINPNTSFIDAEKDDYGFIKTDRLLMTSMMGVYAVGDCRDTPLRQVATAVGDGALAAFMAERYVESLKG
ncbi:MAG TPA: thioredoxin-disulfide reductase [Nitrospirota bacterium]|nr:thioredoxin-disulfide reductase [Nitrospirota bacterium]